ncbi:hypothetical protein MBAV_000148, partial [Candidatus Magnetobacterium bavaricum]
CYPITKKNLITVLNNLGELKKLFMEIYNKITYWGNNRLTNIADSFYCIETHLNITNTSIAELAERKLKNKNSKYLLVNFTNSIFKNYDSGTINKNEPIHIKIDCIDNDKDASIWLERNYSFAKMDYCFTCKTLEIL